MDYRPIGTADLDVCAEVFYAADDDLTARNGLPPSPRNRVALMRLFDHIAATDPERAWLVEEGREVIAFGMSVQRGSLVFLSFLFVRPDHQSRRLGRGLLERSMSGSAGRAVCIFSVQPVAAALYAMYGMVPRVPLYTLTGKPRSDLPALPPAFDVRPAEPDALAELDREVTGFTRPADHRAWLKWERRLFGLFEGDALVGYGYAQQSGRLGPVVVRRPELTLPFVGRLMREIEPLEDWMVHVPGPAAETFVALLRAGMRLDGPPVLFCATDLTIDHGRYLPATFALP